MPSLRDSYYFPLFPGTAVPGFHVPPLRGWDFGDARNESEAKLLSHRSVEKLVRRSTLKALHQLKSLSKLRTASALVCKILLGQPEAQGLLRLGGNLYEADAEISTVV